MTINRSHLRNQLVDNTESRLKENSPTFTLSSVRCQC